MPDEPHIETGDETVDLLMEGAYVAAAAVARSEELRVPMLTLRTADDRIVLAPLAFRDVHPSEAAKVLLHAHEATHAAIAFEAWEVSREATPELLADHAAGRPVRAPLDRPVGEQPDRYDVLMVLGEARGGPTHHRSWRIDGAPPDRTLTARDWRRHEQAPSRFVPLFGSYAEVRRLVYRHAELARLRDDIRSRRS